LLKDGWKLVSCFLGSEFFSVAFVPSLSFSSSHAHVGRPGYRFSMLYSHYDPSLRHDVVDSSFWCVQVIICLCCILLLSWRPPWYCCLHLQFECFDHFRISSVVLNISTFQSKASYLFPLVCHVTQVTGSRKLFFLICSTVD
jgi:hypothetical protein